MPDEVAPQHARLARLGVVVRQRAQLRRGVGEGVLRAVAEVRERDRRGPHQRPVAGRVPGAPVQVRGGGESLRGTARDATIRTGGAGVDGRLLVLNEKDVAMVTLDGTKGDLILHNADCAEDFDVADAERVEPGTVMVLDDEGNSDD